MSVIRSLELVSRSRDRNLYPNPADFTVNVNEMKTSNIALAANPYTNAYPIKGFTGAEAVTAGLFGNILGPGTPGAPYLNSRAKPSGGYYNGMILEQMNYIPPENATGVGVPNANIFSGDIAVLGQCGNNVFINTTGGGLLTQAWYQDDGVIVAGRVPNGFINDTVTTAGFTDFYAFEVSRPNYLNQLPGTGALDYFITTVDPSAGATGQLQIQVAALTGTPITTSAFDSVANMQAMANVLTITGISGPIIRNLINDNAGNPTVCANTDIDYTTFPAANPNRMSFVINTAAETWFRNITLVANDFVSIRGNLTNGNGYCGGVFQVISATTSNVFINGVLRLNTGEIASNVLINDLTMKNIDRGNLLYLGTGNNVIRDLGTNLLKFVNVPPTAGLPPVATPGTPLSLFLSGDILTNLGTNNGTATGQTGNGNCVLINMPGDRSFGSIPLTVFDTGAYADGSNYIAFHDTPYLVLDAVTTSPDGNVQNNFSTYNEMIAIEYVDPINIGWNQTAAATVTNSNFTYLIHKPPTINFTRCLDPNNKYSGITTTNPYVGRTSVVPAGPHLAFARANLAVLNGNIMLETYNTDGTAGANVSYSYFANVFTQCANTGGNIPPAGPVGGAHLQGMCFIPVHSTPGFSFSNTIQLPTSVVLNANATYTFPRSTPIGMSFSNTTEFHIFNVSDGAILNSSPILSYNGNTGLASLQSAFSTGNWSPSFSGTSNGTMWKINNETNILDNTKILIQNGTIVENRYANYFLDNLDQIPRNRTNLIQITSYDSSTKIATLATPLNSPTPAQEFYIRRFPAANSSTTPGSVFLQNVPLGATIINAGTGYTAGQFVNGVGTAITFAINITGVNATGGITAFTILYALGNQGIGTRITINAPAVGTSAILGISNASQGVDISALTTQPPGSVVNTFIFLSKGLLTDGTGPITEVNPDIPCTTASTSSYTGIVVADYNSANVTALVGISNLTRIIAMKNNILPNAASPTAVVSGATSFAGILEFLAFAGDSKNSLEFNASTITTAGQSCYQISLLDLILPNKEIDSFMGGLIAFYPYVYVELQNTEGPMGPNQDVIISNNPEAKKAVFRATISDTTSPTISRFIKLTGSNSISVMKFSPNSQLKFRIYFSDGETFSTLEKDTIPPLPPNPLLQVSALFSIEKMK